MKTNIPKPVMGDESVTMKEAVMALIDNNTETSKTAVAQQIQYAQVSGITTVVVLGASILNGAFDDALEVLKAKSSLGLIRLNVVDEAVSGETSSDLLARLPTVLADYAGQEGVGCLVHIGGNDVSGSKPYSTASDDEKYTLATNLQSIIELIKAEGHRVVLSDISYRTYAGSVPPLDAGSTPFNENIVWPLIKQKLPECWDWEHDRPFVSMYNFVLENQELLAPDGIHLTPEGYPVLLNYWLTSVRRLFNLTSSYLDLPEGNAIVIDFTDDAAVPQPSKFITVADNKLVRDRHTTQGLEGLAVATVGVTGFGSSGRARPGDTTTGLTNNELNRTYIYTNQNPMEIYFCGLRPNSEGVLSLVASRTAAGREAYYTFEGVTVELDPVTDPAPIAEWSYRVNSTGVLRLDVEPIATSDNSYLNGVQLLSTNTPT